MEFDEFVFVFAFAIGLPWLIMHYVTKWKQAPKITDEDEKMLDELYILARRLESRVETVERIVAADEPGFRPGLNPPAEGYHRDFGGHAEARPSLEKRRTDYRLEGRN